MRYWAVLLIALAGCQTEQPANPVQAQKLGESCQAYGFTPGTDAFASCILQLDQQRIAANRQKRMAVADAMSSAGESMQQSAATAQPQRQINCTSTPGMNGVVRTNCY